MRASCATCCCATRPAGSCAARTACATASPNVPPDVAIATRTAKRDARAPQGRDRRDRRPHERQENEGHERRGELDDREGARGLEHGSGYRQQADRRQAMPGCGSVKERARVGLRAQHGSADPEAVRRRQEERSRDHGHAERGLERFARRELARERRPGRRRGRAPGAGGAARIAAPRALLQGEAMDDRPEQDADERPGLRDEDERGGDLEDRRARLDPARELPAAEERRDAERRRRRGARGARGAARSSRRVRGRLRCARAASRSRPRRSVRRRGAGRRRARGA